MSTPPIEDSALRLQQKLQQLLRLHEQYKAAYASLAEVNEQMSEEIQQLRQQLAAASSSSSPATHTQPEAKEQEAPATNSQENAALKRQIQQYLRQIDQTIEWVASLRPPYLS